MTVWQACTRSVGGVFTPCARLNLSSPEAVGIQPGAPSFIESCKVGDTFVLLKGGLTMNSQILIQKFVRGVEGDSKG